jgi:hypothetical protein
MKQTHWLRSYTAYGHYTSICGAIAFTSTGVTPASELEHLPRTIFGTGSLEVLRSDRMGSRRPLIVALQPTGD